MHANDATRRHYRLQSTAQILLTAESGEKLASQANLPFCEGRADHGTVIEIMPGQQRQSLLGIGTSMTEASAFVLAHLEPQRRREVMRAIFGADGADFSLSRVPVGSCDFCVSGRYSYAPQPDDLHLQAFTIAADQDGFDPGLHAEIKDPDYDLLPMIREALAIKDEEGGEALKIVASAWTAPPWMKDIDDWFIEPGPTNGYQGTGGSLKPDHQATYATYLDRYLSAYRASGVEIWAITPVNEPLGNGGHWESMHFSADDQNTFIKQHLGPQLARGENRDVEILIFDHSRDQLEAWCRAIYGDAQSARWVSGAAVHWYESTFRVFEDVFERVHARWPDKLIVHTEGCIDSLGVDAPEGVADPEGYKESGWFDNDDFWWNDNASDYAYSANWPGVDATDHPLYTPVHRYARNIIVSLNHWVAGWIDWNIVLDRHGGPNHVGNFCGAPIMVDTDSGYVYYTPVFYVLAQLSRGMRPGDRVVQSVLRSDGEDLVDLYCCATLNASEQLWVHVLNSARQPRVYRLQVGEQHARIEIPANALQSVRLSLGGESE